MAAAPKVPLCTEPSGDVPPAFYPATFLTLGQDFPLAQNGAHMRSVLIGMVKFVIGFAVACVVGAFLAAL